MTPAPPSPSLTPPSRAQFRRALNTVAGYDESGRLVIAPGPTVLDRVAHPYRALGPGRSLGLSLDFHGYTYWVALYRSPGGTTRTSVTWSGEQDSTFAAWVRGRSPDMVVLDEPTTSAGPDTWPGVPNPHLVRFVGSTERLRPLDGVRILRQAAHVSVGDSFAGPADQTAAALVEAADGERSYVLARRFDGTPAQYIGVPGADGGPTLAAFLDLARSEVRRRAAGGCCEDRGPRRGVHRLRPRPAHPPAPDRLRRLRRLAPRRRPGADRAGQAVRRLATGAAGRPRGGLCPHDHRPAAHRRDPASVAAGAARPGRAGPGGPRAAGGGGAQRPVRGAAGAAADAAQDRAAAALARACRSPRRPPSCGSPRAP